MRKKPRKTRKTSLKRKKSMHIIIDTQNVKKPDPVWIDMYNHAAILHREELKLALKDFVVANKRPPTREEYKEINEPIWRSSVLVSKREFNLSL
jgi:hypothetical protein